LILLVLLSFNFLCKYWYLVATESKAELRTTTQHYIDSFGEEGLRTLALAKRELTVEQFETWDHLFHEATVSLTGDREEIISVSPHH
jgi:magnesium-transporting ATPase (P-type)